MNTISSYKDSDSKMKDEHMPYGGEYIVADIGVAPVFGMMFGPIGGLGQALASLIWQLCEGADPIAALIDFSIMFFISILAYKLWYTPFKEETINTPKFNSTENIFKFLIIAFIVSIVYWALIYISFEAYPKMFVIYPLSSFIAKTAYVLNLFNFTLIFGIFFISIFNIRVYELQEQEKQEKEGAERRSKIGTGDRAEKIRTYNYPQNRVTDHRIGFTTNNLDRIMDGALDEVINALIQEDQRRKLQGDTEE